MSGNFDELIASLPAELDLADDERDAMAELMRSLAGRPVPTSRLARLWALGATPMSLAATSIAAWSKGLFSSEERKILIANEARLRSAMRVLRTMGYLRGAVTKLGQTLASYPKAGPQHLATILGALHFQAPPMHFSLLREQLANELGDDPEHLFAEFETEAFAAASLGQVHRARLRSGEAVAVKIQYPNIARTISSDMSNLKTLLAPLRMTREWKHLAAQLDDVKETLITEADYRREAEYAERARRTLADDPEIAVPRVYEDLSTERVLTLELLDGVHLDDFLERQPPAERKDRHGAQIFRAMSRLFYEGRMVHADPNPGNFLFRPDGTLGLIDFGCCRVFSDDEWSYFSEGIRDFLAHGEPGDEVLRRGALLSDRDLRDEDRMTTIRASIAWLWEPIVREGRFQFDDAYMQRGVDTLAEIMRKRYSRTIPINTWTNRMFYGVRALLCRLDCGFDAAEIHQRALERAGMA